ncbi:MAG: hypothetical protein KBD62_36625 [Kofleriaceae bacterium]|nr:hypothetical protein [Kofleriaceae bacterium]
MSGKRIAELEKALEAARRERDEASAMADWHIEDLRELIHEGLPGMPGAWQATLVGQARTIAEWRNKSFAAERDLAATKAALAEAIQLIEAIDDTDGLSMLWMIKGLEALKAKVQP